MLTAQGCLILHTLHILLCLMAHTLIAGGRKGSFDEGIKVVSSGLLLAAHHLIRII